MRGTVPQDERLRLHRLLSFARSILMIPGFIPRKLPDELQALSDLALNLRFTWGGWLNSSGAQ